MITKKNNEEYLIPHNVEGFKCTPIVFTKDEWDGGKHKRGNLNSKTIAKLKKSVAYNKDSKPVNVLDEQPIQTQMEENITNQQTQQGNTNVVHDELSDMGSYTSKINDFVNNYNSSIFNKVQLCEELFKIREQINNSNLDDNSKFQLNKRIDSILGINNIQAQGTF